MADSDVNVGLIKNVTFLWVAKDYEAILPFVADDAVYVIARGTLEKFNPYLFGTFRGKDAIKGWYKTNLDVAALGAIRPFCLVGTPGEFIGAGDHVINFGTMPASGAEPACDWIAVWTVKNNLIKNCTMVMDTASTFVKLKLADPNLALG